MKLRIYKWEKRARYICPHTQPYKRISTIFLQHLKIRSLGGGGDGRGGRGEGVCPCLGVPSVPYACCTAVDLFYLKACKTSSD